MAKGREINFNLPVERHIATNKNIKLNLIKTPPFPHIKSKELPSF